jgi:hypothetical protein
MSSDPLFFFFVSVIMAMSIFLFSSSVCNSSFFSAIPLTFHVATFIFPVLCPSNLSGYSTYRGWAQTGYLNKHYNINQKDEDA